MKTLALPEIPDELRRAIAFTLGSEEGDAWLETSRTRAALLCAEWMLDPIEVLLGGAMSLCLLCSDSSGQRRVLKIPTDPFSGASEAAALKIWSGQGAPNLLRVDERSSAFLMDFLAAETLDYGVESVIKLASGLNAVHPSGHVFPSVLENIEMRVGWARDRFAVPEYHHHRYDLDMAVRILEECVESDSRNVLLHGDFQTKNLLMVDGRLMVLDPLPGLGSPLFDVAFWIALGVHTNTMAWLVGKACGVMPETSESTLLRWVWGLAVIENRPYLIDGANERQQFIEDHRAEVQ